jgi:hypothetical protein
MDTRPADYLRHRIMRYDRAIEETRDHFAELSPFGKYPASSPYCERSGILALLDSLKKDPLTGAVLLQEFHEADSKLQALEREMGEGYRHQLHLELSACLERYCSAVCQANLGLLKFETDHELFCRDRIFILVRELEKDHDLSGQKNLIRMLDHNLFYTGTSHGGECPEGSLRAAERMPSMHERDKIKS